MTTRQKILPFSQPGPDVSEMDALNTSMSMFLCASNSLMLSYRPRNVEVDAMSFPTLGGGSEGVILQTGDESVDATLKGGRTGKTRGYGERMVEKK